MKNKIFVVITLLVAIGGFAALKFMKPKENKLEAPPTAQAATLIRFHNMSLGNPLARVTLVEFFDPECEACRVIHPVVKKLVKQYGGQVRFVFRYMPFHKNSVLTASAIEEAREMGKYEEAVDLLFETQPVWADHHNPRPDLMFEQLQKIGVPKERLKPEELVKKHEHKVAEDKADGLALGVNGTPTFFINGRMLDQFSEEYLKAAIEHFLKQ